MNNDQKADIRELFKKIGELYKLADECGQLASEIVRDYDDDEVLTGAVPGLPYFIWECEEVVGLSGDVLADLEHQI